MTKMNTLKKATAVALLSIYGLQASAQADAGQLVKAGQQDLNTIFNGYMSPLMKSIGAGLNSGWYQTAKPHGIGGFDLTLSANITFAPVADQSYNLTGLKKLSLAPGEKSTAPTIFGEAKDGPKVEVRERSPITGNDTALTSFNLPQGIGANIFAVPTAQFCVGVGFGTDVAVRFVPKVSAGDAGIGLFGFAVKHDFKQWIPGMKQLPFDLSAMFGYTSMNGDVSFTGNNAITPQNDTNIYNPNPNKRYDNQKIEITSTAWTANIIISKKLGPLTPYLGVGYQNAKTTLAMLGDYPITVPNDINNATTIGNPSFGKVAVINDIKDPVKVEGTLSGFRANAGFRLKLAVLTIHADYTFGQYNVASVGLGLNLQSIVPFKL